MNRFGMLSIGLACAICFGFADAAENSDPSGNWKWSVTNPRWKIVNFTLQLKYSPGALTGTVTLPNKKTVDIEDAKFEDGNITFSTSEQGPRAKVLKQYNRKLKGDSITGKREIIGFSKPEDWEATRNTE